MYHTAGTKYCILRSVCQPSRLSCSLWCLIPPFVSHSFQVFTCYAFCHCKRADFLTFSSSHICSSSPSSSPCCFHRPDQSWASCWSVGLSCMLDCTVRGSLWLPAVDWTGRWMKCVVFCHDSAEGYLCILESGRENMYHGWLAVIKDMHIKINSSGEN